MGAPRVSILLPTRDGERDLERLLPVLARQQVSGGVEFLATDTASRDRSVEFLRRAGFAVESVDVIRPSLEDVFVALTGRHLRDA